MGQTIALLFGTRLQVTTTHVTLSPKRISSTAGLHCLSALPYRDPSITTRPAGVPNFNDRISFT